MDANGQTSLYFATDSRLSWENTNFAWDCGRKVFGCRNQPDIFAFTGYGLFSVTVISRLCSLIDEGLVSDSIRSSLTTRCQWVMDSIKYAFNRHPSEIIDKFTIFYGTRIGVGTAPNSSIRKSAENREDYDEYRGSWFGGCSVTWDGVELKNNQLEFPQEFSKYLAVDGSGGKYVEVHLEKANSESQCNTSRIIFRKFCDALREKKDKYSGGPPQIVGLYRDKAAQNFGVVIDGKPFYLGVSEVFSDSGLQWRNENFERVNSRGDLIEGAKRHNF